MKNTVENAFNEMLSAIKVVTLDSNVRALLLTEDPKALEQLDSAAATADASAGSLKDISELLSALSVQRATGQRIASLSEMILPNYGPGALLGACTQKL